MDLSDITRLISSLRAQTARDSITPNGLGSILQRIVDAISSMSGIDVEDEAAILQRLSAAESNASTALQTAQNAQAGAAGNVIDSFTQSQDEDEVSLSIKQHGHSARQVVLPAASSTGAGIMTATDKSHLDTAYGKRVNLMSAPSSESVVTLTITFGDGTTKSVTFVGATAGTGGKAGLMTKEQADQLADLVAAGPAESVRDDAGYLKQQYAAPIILRNVTDTVFDDLAIGDVYYDTGHLFYHTEDQSGDPDIGAPSRKVIYYCLADQTLYRWTGSRFVQAVSISSGDVTVPTKLSDLINDMGFLTAHQPLKTINGETITGTGNITIDGAAELKDASNHVKQSMATPVVLRNVTATSLDNLQTGDVYFDSGHLFCHVSSSNDVDLDTPSKDLIYFCLADNSYYRWTGSSFTKINSGGEADQQLNPSSQNAVSNAAVCGGLAGKANSADVYPKSQTYSKGEVDDLVGGIEAGERIVFDTEGTPIIDSPLSPNADTVLGAASARWVKEIDNNVKAILAALAGIAFTTGKPTWQSVAKRKYDLTMNASTLTGCTGTVVSGDAGNGQVYEGGVRIKLTPTQASYAFTSVTVNGNSVDTTSADDGLGSVYLDIVVNGNITVAATAISGRGIDFTGSTGCSIGAAGVATGQDLDTTITANEHHTLPQSITVKIGNTNVTHTYTRAQDGKTATLHIDAANITGDLTITCTADEDAHVTIAISGSNFVVKQGNTQLSNGSKIYNGSAAQTLTIEPASGYKFSTQPSADQGTMTNNGPYEASSLVIGTSVSGTLTITAAGATLDTFSIDLSGLVGVTSSNPATSILEGSPYSTTLSKTDASADGGVVIGTCTMGSENIAPSSGLTISVAHVTDNITIAASVRDVIGLVHSYIKTVETDSNGRTCLIDKTGNGFNLYSKSDLSDIGNNWFGNGRYRGINGGNLKIKKNGSWTIHVKNYQLSDNGTVGYATQQISIVTNDAKSNNNSFDVNYYSASDMQAMVSTGWGTGSSNGFNSKLYPTLNGYDFGKGYIQIGAANKKSFTFVFDSDASTISLYIEGTLIGTEQVSNPFCFAGISILTYYGSWDGVDFYNGALNATEVAALITT